MDNCGSSRRGLVFEAPTFGNMGDLEVADQVAGVDWAVAQGIADPHGVAASIWLELWWLHGTQMPHRSSRYFSRGCIWCSCINDLDSV